jgi:hypothetical protein
MIWLETESGAFYFRRIIRTETVAGLLKHYREIGKPDDQCVEFSRVRREIEEV